MDFCEKFLNTARENPQQAGRLLYHHVNDVRSKEPGRLTIMKAFEEVIAKDLSSVCILAASQSDEKMVVMHQDDPKIGEALTYGYLHVRQAQASGSIPTYH